MTSHCRSRCCFLLLLAVLLDCAGAQEAGVRLSITHSSGLPEAAYSLEALRAPELISVGVPFPPGALPSGSPLTVMDEQQHPLSTQTAPLVYWPDRSIKWMLVQFLPRINPVQSYTVMRRAAPTPERPVTVRREGKSWIMSNGLLEVVTDPQQSALGLANVRLPEKNLTAVVPPGLQLEIIRADGQTVSSLAGTGVEVRSEEQGPLHAVLSIRGRLGTSKQSALYEFTTRIELHAAEAAVRLELTLACIGGESMHEIRGIRLTSPSNLKGEIESQAGGELLFHKARLGPEQSLRLLQLAPQLEHPRDFHYRLTRAHADGPDAMVAEGGRSEGWLRLQDANLEAGIAVRSFSELGPAALSVNRDRSFVFDLWPEEAGTLRWAKTRSFSREIFLRFLPAAPPPDLPPHRPEVRDPVMRLATFQQDQALALPYRTFLYPAVPVLQPEYFCSTQALDFTIPVHDSRFQEWEQVLEKSFENFLEVHEKSAWNFGLLNFGDYISQWPSDDGEIFSLHYRDLEWDLPHSAFVMFSRTGDPRYWHRARAAYRHYMDVDVDYLTGQPRHHGYGPNSDQHLELKTRLEWGHVFIDGLADAYVLLGDQRSRETALKIAGVTLGIFETADDEFLMQRAISTHRELGWPLKVLLRAYEITGEVRYRQAAERIMDFLVRGVRRTSPPAITWLDQALVDKSVTPWSVCVLLQGVERYHRMTGDPRAVRVFAAALDWLLEKSWSEVHHDFVYRIKGEAVYSGPHFTSSVIAPAFGYGYVLSGKKRYLEVAYKSLRNSIPTARPLIGGKEWALISHYSPTLMKILTEIPESLWTQLKRSE